MKLQNTKVGWGNEDTEDGTVEEAEMPSLSHLFNGISSTQHSRM